MNHPPRKLGRVTVSFDLIQVSGHDFWHGIREVAEDVVNEALTPYTSYLEWREESGKKIAGEQSKYDLDNITIDKVEDDYAVPN